jgi:hypothetical protein
MINITSGHISIFIKPKTNTALKDSNEIQITL